ncbi:restriction endonuclease subunit S [Rhodococcus chondri]|uniref:Restriction endonuclease subunit S n=1 Tax=Rhodococcus chondri TaxID=3065941 RepID=A0ABU7JSG2_9NOCA|nr:restriction endonuclease subunit S [Rhodococcus sp. CC-R104]MEE2032970.1 restriction endonuclease subunit S [Rhodococcus sp. CC-R104]
MKLVLDKSHWKQVAFGDVIDSVSERVDDPSQAGVDRYVGLEHLDPGVLTVERWDSPDKVAAQKLRFYPGDVIFGRRRAYQKKVAVAEFEGICSAHALVLRANQDFVCPEFLPVFLSSNYFLDRAIKISVGSLSPTVNWRDLKAEKFDLPSISEQKRIADLIWAMERHRRTLSGLADAVKRIENPLMTASADGEVTVADVVVTARSGATPLRSNKDFYGGSIPWLKSGEVVGDGISQTEETITEEGLRRSATWMVPAGAVLVAMYGDGKTRGQVGRTAVPLATNQAVIALVPDDTKCDPDFFYYWMRSRQESLRNKGAGAAQKNLSKAAVVSEPFPSLSIVDQKAAVARLVTVDVTVASVLRESNELRAAVAAIMDSIFGSAA